VVADGRETGRIWGKHRTEVTEVTEGELALWVRGFGDAVADKRETRELGKASHRGHGGHRGGTGFVGKRLRLGKRLR
jgi:hypothetical protein